MYPLKHTRNRTPSSKGYMALCNGYWYEMSLAASVVKPHKPILWRFNKAKLRVRARVGLQGTPIHSSEQINRERE